MAEYTLVEAAKKLGISSAEIEGIIDSGLVFVEKKNNDYLITDEKLLEIRISHRKRLPPGPPPPYSILDDTIFIQYLEDFINLKFTQMNNSQRENYNFLDSRLKEVARNIVDESTMAQLSSPVAPVSVGKTLSTTDINAIKSSIESVLLEKLGPHDSLVSALESLEESIGRIDDRILSSFERIQKYIDPSFIESRLEGHILRLGNVLEQKIADLSNGRAELSKADDRVKISQSLLESENPDLKEIALAIRALEDGQRKAGRLMIELNTTLQKTFMEKIDEIRWLMENTPRYIEEMKKMLPNFWKHVDKQMGKVDQIAVAVENFGKSLNISRLSSLLESLAKSTADLNSGVNGDIEAKVLQMGANLENIIIQSMSRQRKTLDQYFELTKTSGNAIKDIRENLEHLDGSFSLLSQSLDSNFTDLQKTVKRLHVVNRNGNNGGGEVASGGSHISLETDLIEEQLQRIQETLEKFYKQFEISDVNHISYYSKLENLDRLNELIPIRDSVEEIAEQMQTFEIITARVDEIVEERLQSLTSISRQLSSQSHIAMVKDVAADLSRKLNQFKSIIERFDSQYSIESILGQIKKIMAGYVDDLKADHEATEKVLSNLSYNTQSWISEKLDQLSSGSQISHHLPEYTGAVESASLEFAALIDENRKKVEEFSEKLHSLSHDQTISNALDNIQKLLEDEFGKVLNISEASRNILVDLGVNNQKALLEKMESAGLSSAALDDILQKNRELLAEALAGISPRQLDSSVFKDTKLLLQVISENLKTDRVLEEVKPSEEGVSVPEGAKNSDGIVTSFASISRQMKEELLEKIESLSQSISKVEESLGKGEKSVTSALLENQKALMEGATASHREIIEQIRDLTSLHGKVSAASSPDGILSSIHDLFKSQSETFQNDLNNNRKVLANLNLNLQKQILVKIREILKEEKSFGNLGGGSLLKDIEGLLESKMKFLKEGQEALLEVNLSTQRSFSEKLQEISSLKSFSSDVDGDSLLSVLEKILANRMGAIQESYWKAYEAMENISQVNNKKVLERLDLLLSGEGEKSSPEKISKEVQKYLEDFRIYLDALVENITLQTPENLGDKFSEIKKLLQAPSLSKDLAAKVENSIESNLQQYQDTLNIIKERVEKITDSEVRPVGESVRDEILAKLEETRAEQEKASRQIEIMLGSLSSSGPGEITAESYDALKAESEALKDENFKYIGEIERLRNKNREIAQQLKDLLLGDGRAVDTNKQFNLIMEEKDILLDSCYREKQELRAQLERQQRESYELIQQMEIEKKELIDALSLEKNKHQRDRIDLETLRTEARKKKWW